MDRNTKLIDIDCLSVRLVFACKEIGINTIGELTDTPERLIYRKVGDKVFREIRDFLQEIKNNKPEDMTNVIYDFEDKAIGENVDGKTNWYYSDGIMGGRNGGHYMDTIEFLKYNNIN